MMRLDTRVIDSWSSRRLWTPKVLGQSHPVPLSSKSLVKTSLAEA